MEFEPFTLGVRRKGTHGCVSARRAEAHSAAAPGLPLPQSGGTPRLSHTPQAL